MSGASLVRRAAGFLLGAAALGFVGLRIAQDWRRLAAFDWEVHGGQIALSLAALIAVLYWGVFVWHCVLTHFEHPPIPYGRLAQIWYLSALTRYIPGKIWQFVSVTQLGRTAGLGAPTLLTSLLVHVGFGMLSAAVIAAATLPLAEYPLGSPAALILSGLAVASLFLVHPSVINRVLGWVPRALHRGVLRWTGRWRDGLFLLFLSLVSWLGYGLAFALFLDAVVPLDGSAVVPLVGVNALSFLAGYIVFLTPAGLGPREAAMTLLLGPYLPPAFAALAAVLSRIWTIAAELAGTIAVLAWRRRGNGSEPGPPGATGPQGARA